MRFLPHLNDDGGFFVAILRKTGLMPWEKPSNSSLENEEDLSYTSQIRGKLAKLSNNRRIREMWIPHDRTRFIADDGQDEDEELRAQIEKDLDFLGIVTEKDDLVRNLFSLKFNWNNLKLTNAAVKNFIRSTYRKPYDLNYYYAGTDFLEWESLSIASQKYKVKGRSEFGARAFALPRITRRLELGRTDFLAVIDSPENVVWNDEEKDGENNPVILSSECVRKLRDFGLGPVKLVCRLEGGKHGRSEDFEIEEEEEEDFVEVLAFVGGVKLLVRALPQEKYHCRLLLENQ